MSQKSYLKKINSSYLLKAIIDNISTLKKLKLFIYSKEIQNKLDLTLFDYQERYIQKFKIDWKKFLSIKYSMEGNNVYTPDNSEIIKNRNFLIQKLNEKLSQNNIQLNDTIIKEIAYNYFRKLKIKNKSDEFIFDGNKYLKTPKDILIDINSPLFGHICQEEIFQKIFSIVLIDRQIDNLKLKSEYIEFFKKLNEVKAKYASLALYLTNPKNIDYIKDFNININQIQRLYINIQIINELEYFFNTLFNFNNINKNLTYLNLDFLQEENYGVDLSDEMFNGINNLNSLLYLKLSGINFAPNFELNLSNLKEIKFFLVNNITFSENYPNLTKLNLKECSITKPNKLMICPELEICKINLTNENDEFIDFSVIKKLKNFKGTAKDFIKLDNSNKIKKVNLISKNDLITQENIFKKLITMKAIENINLIIFDMNSKQIAKIPGTINSIKELSMSWIIDSENCVLYDVQSKFPNLLSLNLRFPFNLMESEENASIIINENNNYKINELSISNIGNSNVELFTGPFTNLKKIQFNFDSNISNIQTFFPIFNNICPITFHNLTTFEFTCINDYIIKNEILNNIYNNFDKMMNLKRVYFMCISTDASEEFYKAFIKKILKLKLNYVYLCLMKVNRFPEKKYSLNELKQFCDEINCNIDEMNVYKFIGDRRNEFAEKANMFLKNYKFK